MTYTAHEGHERILDDLAAAIDELALALACLGDLYEQLDDRTADRLEQELFRPVQLAFGRAKRTHTGFSERQGIPPRAFAERSAGLPSQSAAAFVERATLAAGTAAQTIAELQDSMLPVEVGDPELRAGLAEVRELVDDVPSRAREFIRILGR